MVKVAIYDVWCFQLDKKLSPVDFASEIRAGIINLRNFRRSSRSD